METLPVCILSNLKCRIFQFQIFDWDKCLEFFLGNLLSVLFILIFGNKEYAVITTAVNSLYSFSNRHSALSAGTSLYFLLLDHLEVQCFHRDFRFYRYRVKCLV